MSHVAQVQHKSSLGLKRKIDDPTTSFVRQAPHKVIKAHEAASPQRPYVNGSSGTENNRFTTEIEPGFEDDVEAGPAPPPEDEDDEDDSEDDEEGRFFGGGVSKQERDVLKYVEENEEEGAEERIDLVWLKKTALSFERKINKNAELRAKYADDPMKFVASEADLDSEIKSLTLMSEHPELFQDFVRSGCVNSLVSLLAHDNTDIAISACEVIEELLDEDLDVKERDWEVLVNSMLHADLIELLVSNLYRLDQTNEADRNGTHHVLSIFEALLSDTANAEKLGQSSKLLAWLVDTTQKSEEASTRIGQNRQYAAELLVILSQNSSRTASELVKLGFVDTLLQLLSTWRSKDPEENSEEEEFAENLFDCLIGLVKLDSGAKRFVTDEGVELCVLMVKEGRFARRGALRILDHAAGSANGTMVCEQIVEAGGLKTLFTTFMKSKKMDRRQTEHLLGVFSGMLRQLPGSSAARVRTLAKFVEKDYEKCNRLLELRREYAGRVAAIDQRIQQERLESGEDAISMTEPERLSRRLDAGLFVLQTLDVILAWLVAEDSGARLRIESVLKAAGSGLDMIKLDLQGQLDGIEIEDDSGGVSIRAMLETLIECL